MTSPAPVRRPTRDEALDNSARVAAEIWLELTPEQQARIVAARKAAERRAS